MQIVIDIDDVDYEYIKNGCIVPIKYDNHIYNAIRNSTPLPKGHGDIIDVSELEEIYLNDESLEDIQDAIFAIKRVTPIIKADKAESKEE